MDMTTKPVWEQLPEELRKIWIQQVINFYPPAVVSEKDAVELAREEYADAETLLPEPVMEIPE
jgi:hypothetical protein